MAKSTEPRARTIEVTLVVLGIDSNFDPATKAAFDYREKQVYPQIQGKGYAVEKCQGPLAKRFYVAPRARQPGVLFMTGVGHGSYDTFMGQFYDPIFTVGGYHSEESRGKIVHFLSCQAAGELGPDFVKNGCLAYFGYDEDFVFHPDFEEMFFECDSDIDRAFADGLRAEKVYERVRDLFQKRITELRAAGHVYAASLLATDLDHLRSPASGGTDWGDPNAKLP